MDGINGRLGRFCRLTAENIMTWKHKDRNNPKKHRGEKGIKNEQNISDQWDTFRQLHIDVIGLSGKGKYKKILEEIIVEVFLNLVKIISP